MIQIKEFLNYQNEQDNIINRWLQEKGESIEIIDIKYSVGTFQADEKAGWNAQEFSGVLIIYKIISKGIN